MVNITQIYQSQKAYFSSGATRGFDFRREQLLKLKAVVKENEQAILDALYSDLRKPAMEAYASEIGFLYEEINHALKHLADWMQPETATAPLTQFPSTSKIIKEPLGVVLIIGPWNYPFQLIIDPLVGAMAAGNCAILKPSELAPATSQIMADLITKNFDPAYIAVVEGDGATVTPALMEHPFNHVFFTGSIPVGKKVLAMAAPHLTPTTLELGGKSPCIVDQRVNLKVAAKRIVWGKFWNAGQTCVAPDYLVVHEKVKTKLLIALQSAIQEFFGQNPQESPDYGRIINHKRFQTLRNFIGDGKLLWGGKFDENDLYIEPTILTDVPADAPVMQEEIFGPILPVISFSTKEEALHIIAQHPNPLSLYVFTNDVQMEQFYTENIAFGGGCVNNTLVHLTSATLPFGGVGASGMGRYHGQYSFDLFSHHKSIMKTGTWLDVPIKYPPFGNKLKTLKLLMK